MKKRLSFTELPADHRIFFQKVAKIINIHHCVICRPPAGFSVGRYDGVDTKCKFIFEFLKIRDQKTGPRASYKASFADMSIFNFAEFTQFLVKKF